MRHPTTTVMQAGFTLFELMIAIAVIAILTAIGVPSYQGYIQKAALTDMLQLISPYKTAVELCSLEYGVLAGCNAGSQGIPVSKASSYVSGVTVTAGAITLTGQATLTGLTASLTPTLSASSGELQWAKSCTTTPANQKLEEACNAIFRF